MSEPTRGSVWSSRLLVALGLPFVAAYVVFLFFLMDRSTWDTWGGMFIGPALFLVTVPALARQARREGDSRVFWFLVIALAVKMLFSLFRYYHAFVINAGDGADAKAYDRVATEIALRFREGNFTTGLDNLWESNFIRLFTGIVYTVIRPSVVSGYLLYAWLAFLGTYFFYRAFVLALPDGDRYRYARWLFFMPSILFWPSSIGKESWMLFALGIAAFGAAKALHHRLIPGLVLSAFGIGLASLVRAPVAVVLGAGLVLGGILRRPGRRADHLTPLKRLGTFALFAVVALVLALTMNRYLVRSGFGGLGVNDLITESEDATSSGGSEFTPTPITSPVSAVTATITVLFRPFVFEANTPEAIGTALESSVLALVALLRFRSFLSAGRNIRTSPYVAVAFLYVAGSIFALSPVANFGIIARQRTLIYPMFLALMCYSARRRGGRRPDREAVDRSELPPVDRHAQVPVGVGA